MTLDEQMICDIAKAIGDATRGLGAEDVRCPNDTWEKLARAAHSVMAGKVAELTKAGRALVTKIDSLADGQCGPFAIRNAVANSHEMDNFRAALAPYPERRSE